MLPEVKLGIDDYSLIVWMADPAKRTETIQVYPVENIPIEVSAWIHFLQKRFGEPEIG